MTPLSQLLAGPRPDWAVVALRGDTELTLGALRRKVARGTAWLRAKEVRRALLVQEDTFEFLATLLAVLHAGAEVVMPPNSQPGTVQALRGETDLLLTELPEAESAAALMPLDAEVAGLGFFTSGSTGERKRIPKALAQLEREVAVLESLWGGTHGAAQVLGMVSHQHIFGLTFGLLWPAMAGRIFAARNPFAWEALLAGLHDPSVLVVAPAHLARMDGLAPLPPHHAPRAILTAGAPLGFAAAQQCRALLGVMPTEIFGSTETGAIAWRQQNNEDSLWQALPGTRLSVRDGGLLDIRSGHLAPGEVVRSADRVELTPSGFRFAGRADRVVKVAGKRVSLAALEADLAVLDEVEEAALLMSDETLGALVVPTTAGRAALAAEGSFRFERRLRRALEVRHEPSTLPRLWRLLPALPLDGMGKWDRPAMEALLLDPTPREPVVTALRSGAGGIELDLALPPTLFWFQGHFPDHPLLPGVVQLHWAITYAQRHLGLRAIASQVQVKFSRPIRPWDRLTLTLTPDGHRLSYSYRRVAEVCASGSLELA